MLLYKLGDRIQAGFTTWGCMWEKGRCMPSDRFVLSSGGKRIPVQSKITAYWPDGSVKWTAHTADGSLLGQKLQVTAAAQGDEETADGLAVTKEGGRMTISAGRVKAVIDSAGEHLFECISFLGKAYLKNASPVLLLEEHKEEKGVFIKQVRTLKGRIDGVSVEEAGPLYAVIKYTGIHTGGGEEKLPFVIRMKIGYDSPEVSFDHTFIYDGDENRDFLKGLGISFEAPLAGPLYNRHVKFTGDCGVFHESMAQLLSWHPRVPEEIYRAQMKGERLEPEEKDAGILQTVLKAMPFWDTYELNQDSVNHFAIRKKTRAGDCCYLDCLHGSRTDGGAALGSEHGSVLLSIRDFWEKYPSGYTFSGMTTDCALITAWFWAPGAEAMDFRHYANRGYNQIYYEGYDYKGADPDGIACTSQMSLALSGAVVPKDAELEDFTLRVKYPLQYVATPKFYHSMRAFGYWSLPSRNTELETWLEEQLDLAVDFYRDEVEQRNWYGMFNYGDFMHTYDQERHQWRYDMGGFAWDNTELVPTLWLWYEFMRTGREDVFILAEKLSRHTCEVDVYHTGRYKGLGSRHNVRHWGCPCKEARIAMAAHHRFYYYLTGDRRLGDIFDEWKDNENSFLSKDPLGDFYDKGSMVYPSHARSGPDWSSLCANWMTAWERRNDNACRDKILAGLSDIKKAPLKLISGPDFEFDPATAHLRYIGERASGGTHLQICMGAPQIWMEMADLLGDEEWKQMMADYGRFYYLPREEQLRQSDGLIGEREFSLPFMAASMGAYGAAYKKDRLLAERTWMHLLHALIHDGNHGGFTPVTLKNRGNRKELKEIPWISTNFTAQWCLNVIVCLAFIRESLPDSLLKADTLVAGMNPAAFRKA